MANSDKNILITPNRNMGDVPQIIFTGKDGNPISLYVLDTGSLSFEGSAGQLFSITDTFSGSIFSVNNISGLPSIEVLDTGVIKLAEFGGEVGIGVDTPDSRLHIKQSADSHAGGIKITQSATDETWTAYQDTADALWLGYAANSSGSYTQQFKFTTLGDLHFYNGLTETARIDGGDGDLFFRQWYSYENSAYYIRLASSSTSINVAGSIVAAGDVSIGAGLSPASPLHIKQSADSHAGGIKFTQSATDDTFSIFQDTAEYLKFYYATTTGATVNVLNISKAGNIYANVFYDLGNGAYYLDPASTGTSLKVAGDIYGGIPRFSARNVFGDYKGYSPEFFNFFWLANLRFNVSASGDWTSINTPGMFAGNWDYTNTIVSASGTASLNIVVADTKEYGADGITYGYGAIYVCGYGTGPDNVWGRYRDRNDIWYNFTNVENIGQGSNDLWKLEMGGNNYIREYELTFTGQPSPVVSRITAIEMNLRRPVVQNLSGLDRYTNQTLFKDFTWYNDSYTQSLFIDSSAARMVIGSDTTADSQLHIKQNSDDHFGGIKLTSTSDDATFAIWQDTIDILRIGYAATGAGSSTSVFTFNSGFNKSVVDLYAPIYYDTGTTYFLDLSSTGTSLKVAGDIVGSASTLINLNTADTVKVENAVTGDTTLEIVAGNSSGLNPILKLTNPAVPVSSRITFDYFGSDHGSGFGSHGMHYISGRSGFAHHYFMDEAGNIQVLIADSGDVGIGTFHSASYPQSRLHIKQSANFASGGIKIEKSDQTKTWSIFQDGSGILAFSQAATSSADPTNNLLLYPSDKAVFGYDIAVATSSPQSRLHIKQSADHAGGGIKLEQTATTETWAINVKNLGHALTFNYSTLPTSGFAEAASLNGSGDFYFSNFYDINNTAYYLKPSNTGTSLNVAGSIVAAGDVSIGQATPSSALHIKQSADSQLGGFKMTRSGSETNTWTAFVGAGNQLEFGYNTTMGGGPVWSMSVYDTFVAVSGHIQASSFKDQNNTAYYLDPANTGTSLNVAGDVFAAGSAHFEYNGTAGGLQLESGDNNTAGNNAVQIDLGFAGSTNYAHYITTRHNGTTAVDNAIEFYTGDGTAAGVYPTNAILGLSIENGKIGVGINDGNGGIHLKQSADSHAGGIKLEEATGDSDTWSIFSAANGDLYFGHAVSPSLTPSTEMRYDFADSMLLTANMYLSGDLTVVGDVEIGGSSYQSALVNTDSSIPWQDGNIQAETLTGNTTFTFTNNPLGPTTLILRITNPSTYTVEFPAAVKWEGGTEPAMNTAGDWIVTFVYDGTTYYGGVSGPFS